MTDELTATVAESGSDGEITARFSRDELVRGWRPREPRTPRVIPIIKMGVRTDLGRIRENNEDKSDFYEPEDPTLLAARGCLYAVADGMGGHAAGQIASEMALKNVLSSYYDSETDEIPNALLEALFTANTTVHNVATMVAERNGMGTTMTAAVVAEDRVYVGQVGDSRAYLIRDGAIRQVTFDHSWVAEQVRMGTLTPEEAETSPYRNVITRSIGTQPEVDPDVFVEEALAGDIWVLCSDGLTGHVQDEEIRLIASTQPPTEAARQLIELANSRGGRDNITVLIFQIRDLVLPSDQDGNASDAQESNGPRPDSQKRSLKRLFGK
jgi:protein phosphatase